MTKNVIWTEKSDTERNGWKKEASKIQYMATVWAVSAIVSIVLNRNRKKMLFCNVTLCTAKSFDYRIKRESGSMQCKTDKNVSRNNLKYNKTYTEPSKNWFYLYT